MKKWNIWVNAFWGYPYVVRNNVNSCILSIFTRLLTYRCERWNLNSNLTFACQKKVWTHSWKKWDVTLCVGSYLFLQKKKIILAMYKDKHLTGRKYHIFKAINRQAISSVFSHPRTVSVASPQRDKGPAVVDAKNKSKLPNNRETKVSVPMTWHDCDSIATRHDGNRSRSTERTIGDRHTFAPI